MDPLSYLRNLFVEERNIQVKTIENPNGTYIQGDSDGDMYLKALSLTEYIESIKTHFIDIIEEIKYTGSSWKM